MLTEGVCTVEHRDEELARFFLGNTYGVEEELVLPVNGAEGEDVALVGDDVHELESVEETSERGVDFALLLSDFHGDGDVVPVCKAEGEECVRNGDWF